VIRHGSPPFLECSSRGDRRLGAFGARIRARGNRSIEELYQAAKVFEDGSTGLTWRQAKGRRAVNQDVCARFYGLLWREYVAENPELHAVLRRFSGLSDMFGKVGHCCQATELWAIREVSVGLVKRAACGEPLAETCMTSMELFAKENGFPLGPVELSERPGMSVFTSEHEGRQFAIGAEFVIPSPST